MTEDLINFDCTLLNYLNATVEYKNDSKLKVEMNCVDDKIKPNFMI